MKRILILILFLLPFFSNAQSCNCSDNFKSLIAKIKNNYVGYKDKVNASNQQRFDVFTDSLQEIAKSSEKMKCFDICAEWLSFFKDQHIGLSFTPGKATKEEVNDFFSTAEKTAWNEKTLDAYLLRNKGRLDGIEGYWNYAPDTYKIGIVKDSTPDSDEFVGFIVGTNVPAWKNQQVKLRIKKIKGNYQLIYFRGIDHGKKFPWLIVAKDSLELGYFGVWYKSKFFTNKYEPRTLVKKSLSPSFKVLDKETDLLVIPSFAFKYKKEVDSILKKNKGLLQTSKHLIIDIRNNSGGLTSTFEQLLPYIYTNPIYTDGGVVWATPDNIKNGYDTDISGFPEQTQKKFREETEKLKAHVGELYPLYGADTIEFSHVLKNPQRVSVLMNRGSASAAEHFILRAEQSKKVTLFGQNSAGAIDYTEVVSGKISCSYFTVQYPAFRSDRIEKRPLNNIGITPGIVIPDQTSDWIDFVRTYKTAN
ncbi:hypothetical protein AY601_1968 [Pedobacter cryoconitis]|uniref:Tail specific protease domain-containing protein n=1 Tax=Pedobacter cryoconitis TaxID=188932 RepID=A0A127VC49_9SPHI|nr:S41 family peptidase [Pedobacter cryoconitis]AMP98874.1 hypothetical protein AY601_1968 [Pedobacter cryoconitis]